MARTKKLVGVTIAVVLATVLVAYMLRPSAEPTTAGGTTNKPPSDPTCWTYTRGIKELTCGPPTTTTNGGGQGSTGDHHSKHHGHDKGHHGHWDGDHGQGHRGDHGKHSDRGHGHSEHRDR